MKDRQLAILFLVPGILLSAIFIILPFVLAVKFSFYKIGSFIGVGTFCGLRNYIDLVQDSRFWMDSWNGIVYTVLSVGFQVLSGIGFAMLLNEKFKGRGFLRGSVVIPYILPTVVVALIWYWMLNEQIGIVNTLLKKVGITGVLWFENPTMAMISIILVSVWTWTPFVTVCFLAGLQSISKELYNAAKVDGASGWDRFIHITLPVLKPILIIVILLRGIWMFNKFDIIWLLTQG